MNERLQKISDLETKITKIEETLKQQKTITKEIKEYRLKLKSFGQASSCEAIYKFLLEKFYK